MADRNSRREGQYGGGYGRRQQSDRFRGTGDWERDENYFGSGRQSYGDGMSEYDQGRGMASSWRDTSFDRDQEQGGSRYEGRDYGRQYNRGYDRGWQSDYDRGNFGSDYDQGYSRNYGQSDYGQSYSSDHPRSSSSGYSGGGYGDYRRSASRGYSGGGRSSYGRGSEGYRGGGRYGYRYPDSEYGFATDRERMDDRGWWDRASDEVASWFGDEEAARRREIDERRGGGYGQYRGRGPRGYSRSDDRIKEDINDRLTYHAFIDASDIDVEVDGGDVVLSGKVNSRYEKRYAEDVAEEVNGVNNVENRLRVESSRSESYTGDTSTTTDTETTTGRTRAASQS